VNTYARLLTAGVAVVAVGTVGLAISGAGRQSVALATPSPLPTAWPAADFMLRAPQGWSRILRVEPDGEPVVILTPDWKASAEASADSSPQPRDAADITWLEAQAPCYSDALCVGFEIARAPEKPPRDPRKEWVGYGLVVDNDGDGMGDVMIGVDNALAGPRAGPRSWQVDLSNGQLLYESTGYGAASTNGLIPWFVEPGGDERRGWVSVPRPLAGPIRMTRASDGRGTRFYLFAGLVRDSEVVAVDFAPDSGWLEVIRYGP
jgi:hypothetical protein